MERIKIGFCNHKGGCGKTTLAVHVAFRAVELGKRLLLGDWDSQQNALKWFSSYEWDGDEEGWQDNEVLAVPMRKGEEVDFEDFEYVIYDFPPNAPDLVEEIRCDFWIVPVNGRLSIEGAVDIRGIVKGREDKMIIVRNETPVRETGWSRDELEAARRIGADAVFGLPIPRSDSLRRAEIMGRPVWDIPFGMRSKAAQNILAFADWVLKTRCRIK